MLPPSFRRLHFERYQTCKHLLFHLLITLCAIGAPTLIFVVLL